MSHRKGFSWLCAIVSMACTTSIDAKPGGWEMAEDPPPVRSNNDASAVNEAATLNRPRNKRPRPPTTWIDGPDVSNRALVLKWLDGLGPGARVRLPVGLVRSPLGGVEHATVVGGPLTADGRAKRHDGLVLALDDSRLGISLADRIRATCGAQTDKPCAMWIMGEWRAGPLLPMPGRASSAIPFAVTDTGDRVLSHPNAPPRVARAAGADEIEPKTGEVKGAD